MCLRLRPSATSTEPTSTSPTVEVVQGWAIDAQNTHPIAVHVYVNGVLRAGAIADGSRVDVGAAYPSFGDRHGYVVSVPADSGTNIVCIYGINVGVGVNSLVGCRIVTIEDAPFGSVDRLDVGVGLQSVVVQGWAIDAQTVDPIAVHVYVNGVLRGGGCRGWVACGCRGGVSVVRRPPRVCRVGAGARGHQCRVRVRHQRRRGSESPHRLPRRLGGGRQRARGRAARRLDRRALRLRFRYAPGRPRHASSHRCGGRMRPRALQWTGFGLPVVPAFNYIASVATNGAGPDGDYSTPSDHRDAAPRGWMASGRWAASWSSTSSRAAATSCRSCGATKVCWSNQTCTWPSIPNGAWAPTRCRAPSSDQSGVDELNAATQYLADLVRVRQLPRKVVVLHQFTPFMIRERERLMARPELSVVYRAGRLRLARPEIGEIPPAPRRGTLPQRIQAVLAAGHPVDGPDRGQSARPGADLHLVPVDRATIRRHIRSDE